MSRATIPDRPTAEPESEHDSEYHSESDQPRGAPSRERRTASTRDRRNRGGDREGRRDRRPVPKDIKLKAVPLQLQLTDPITQYGRWFFNLKGYLMTQDPNYKILFKGQDEKMTSITTSGHSQDCSLLWW